MAFRNITNVINNKTVSTDVEKLGEEMKSCEISELLKFGTRQEYSRAAADHAAFSAIFASAAARMDDTPQKQNARAADGAEVVAEGELDAPHANQQCQVEGDAATLNAARDTLTAAAKVLTCRTEAKQSLEAIHSELKMRSLEVDNKLLRYNMQELQHKAEESTTRAVAARAEAQAALAERDKALSALELEKVARADAAARIIELEGALGAAIERENVIVKALQEKEKELQRRLKTDHEWTYKKEQTHSVIHGCLGQLKKVVAVEVVTRAVPAAPREPPEYDDNALCAPPRLPRAPTPATGAIYCPPHPYIDESLIDNLFLDSSSADAVALEPRFEAQSRGMTPPGGAHAAGRAPSPTPAADRAPAVGRAPSPAPAPGHAPSSARKRILFNKRIEARQKRFK